VVCQCEVDEVGVGGGQGVEEEFGRAGGDSRFRLPEVGVEIYGVVVAVDDDVGIVCIGAQGGAKGGGLEG